MSTTQTTPTAAPATRDGFLDAIKAIALWRLVVWHALAWPWLSWFAAMPAMFYVAGLLLQQSLDRHGRAATWASRIRRLLVPFWVFGAVALAAMALSGWRPDRLDLLAWIIPLGDPTGSEAMPGLWIPLWYLRAYLWILLAAPVLSWACRRLGPAVLLGPVAATLGVWWIQQAGRDVPLALADAALFPAFAMAGMLTAMGRIDTRRRGWSLTIAIGAAVAAAAWAIAVEPAPAGIVNSSLPLHLLVGTATIAALAVARRPLAHPPPRIATFITWSSSRALTIYLWHGIGLVAADRLVHRHDLGGWQAAIVTLPTVVAVTLTAAMLLGGIEDLAARRRTRATSVRLRLATAPGAILVVLALVAGGVAPDAARLVPSGQAVAIRAERAELTPGSVEDLAPRVATSTRLDDLAISQAFDRWVDEHADLLDELETSFVEVSLADDSDEVLLLSWTSDGAPREPAPFPWWSMTKTLTVGWMMMLSDDDVVTIDQPVADLLADIPHGDEFTFEQLASHRAGLSSSLDNYLLAASPIDDIGAYIETPDLAYTPGESYDYSRIGYHILTWGLEEASGSSWRDAMEDLAASAGVEIAIDEDLIDDDRITHPGDGSYTGGLWGAGGLVGTTTEGARLFRWLLMEALDEDDVRRMATAPTEHSTYGLGLAPLCPCLVDDGVPLSNRVGIATATGGYVVDLSSGIGLMLHSDNWWGGEVPIPEFDDLLNELLDAAAHDR